MAKRREYKIKWTESQWRRLAGAVRSYNNAVRKAKAADPNASVYLPSEVDYHSLKAGITTARALKNTVNRLKRATVPGALEPVRQEGGGIVTKWERREFSILKSVRERRKVAEARKLKEPKKRKHTLGSYKQTRLEPDRRKGSELSEKGLRRFIETQSIELAKSSRERAERYFENYIAALERVFGGFAEYDEDVSRIKEIIRNDIESGLPDMDEWLEDSPALEFIYDPYERAMKMDVLTDYWLSLERWGR